MAKSKIKKNRSARKRTARAKSELTLSDGKSIGGVVVLVVILLGGQLVSANKTSLKQVLRKPYDPQLNLRVAEELIQANQVESAQTLLNLTQGLVTSPEQTAAWTRNQAILDKTSPERIRGQIESWQIILNQKPNYRDGYLQAAILAYKLGDKEQAKEYLHKAYQIDPNYPQLVKLEQLLL